MVLLPMLLAIAATASPAPPAQGKIALARVTARIVSGVAFAGASIKTSAGAPNVVRRNDPSNGQSLLVAEFQ